MYTLQDYVVVSQLSSVSLKLAVKNNGKVIATSTDGIGLPFVSHMPVKIESSPSEYEGKFTLQMLSSQSFSYTITSPSQSETFVAAKGTAAIGTGQILPKGFGTAQNLGNSSTFTMNTIIRTGNQKAYAKIDGDIGVVDNESKGDLYNFKNLTSQKRNYYCWL